MARSTRSRSRARAPRLRIPCKPFVEPLEYRLPPGDTLGGPFLSGMLASRRHDPLAGVLFASDEMHALAFAQTGANAMRQQPRAPSRSEVDAWTEAGPGRLEGWQVRVAPYVKQLPTQDAAEKVEHSTTRSPAAGLFSYPINLDFAVDLFDVSAWFATPWLTQPRAAKHVGTSNDSASGVADDRRPVVRVRQGVADAVSPKQT
jgi:hypothetical protein